MLFKDLLQQTMDERHLSVKDVETLSGVKKVSIEQYLSEILPSSRDMNALCEALNIDKDDITFDEYTISVNEARTMMRVSPEFVKQNIRNGRMPGCWVEGKHNDTFKIPRQAFMQFLKEWNSNAALRAQLREMDTQIGELNNQVCGLTEQVCNLTELVKTLGSAILEVVGYIDNMKKMSHPTTNDDATKRL